jgi:DNA repair protein RadA/Sms
MPTQIPTPRRSAQGVDSGRLSLLTAVLQQRANVAMGTYDVYALAVGGVKVVEPAADLPLALAMASSRSGHALPSDLVVCGEVGLGGELRQVSQLDRRLNEAARLGFTQALIPRLSPEPPAGMTAIRAGTLAEAINLMGLAP